MPILNLIFPLEHTSNNSQKQNVFVKHHYKQQLDSLFGRAHVNIYNDCEHKKKREPVKHAQRQAFGEQTAAARASLAHDVGREGRIGISGRRQLVQVDWHNIGSDRNCLRGPRVPTHSRVSKRLSHCCSSRSLRNILLSSQCRRERKHLFRSVIIIVIIMQQTDILVPIRLIN